MKKGKEHEKGVKVGKKREREEKRERREGKWGESRGSWYSMQRRSVFPFNREPALPDKATCNLSQLVLFGVSRFSGSLLYRPTLSGPIFPLLPLFFPTSVLVRESPIGLRYGVGPVLR